MAGKLEEKGISMVIQKTCSLLYILGLQPWQYPIPSFLISLIDLMEVQCMEQWHICFIEIHIILQYEHEPSRCRTIF